MITQDFALRLAAKMSEDQRDRVSNLVESLYFMDLDSLIKLDPHEAVELIKAHMMSNDQEQ